MKFKSDIYTFVASVAILFSACTPDSYDLGSVDFTTDDLVEGLAYTVTHDADNPNIIYLTSLLDAKYTPLWEHPQGRSQEQIVTLKIPFAGTYSVTFGVETRGGIVYGEPTTFTIDDFYAGFLEDDLWTYISGGVGSSKKWFLDVDAEGVSRYFNGPVYFYGTDDSWASVTEGEEIAGDSWSWEATLGDVAGWQFSSEVMDFGYMEFDLINGSNVTVVMNELNKTMTGVYMLDTDNHTITFTDAELLHDAKNDSQVDSWSGTLKVLSITEDAMQIAVVRTSDPCLLSFNFISEEYYNNWTPTVNNDIVPELPDDWRDYVEPKTNLVITYKLFEDDPFDWCNLDGSLKGITTVPAVSGVEDITLVINSGTGEYTFTDINGNDYTGKYTLSNDGIYTFDALPEVVLSTDGRAIFKTNTDGTLRIMQYETSDYTGGLTDLWLGSQEVDAQGNLYQYMAYHFEVQSADAVTNYKATLNFFDTGWNFINSDAVFISTDGDYTLTIEGESSSPFGLYLDIEKILKDHPDMDVAITDIKVDGASINFDDTIIDRGIGDAETTARRYIVNPWGLTADDASNYKFNSSIAVTIHVKFDNGTPFIPE